MCIYLYTYKDLNKLMAKDALLLCLFLSFLVLLSCLLLFFFFLLLCLCVCLHVCALGSQFSFVWPFFLHAFFFFLNWLLFFLFTFFDGKPWMPLSRGVFFFFLVGEDRHACLRLFEKEKRLHTYFLRIAGKKKRVVSSFYTLGLVFTLFDDCSHFSFLLLFFFFLIYVTTIRANHIFFFARQFH